MTNELLEEVQNVLNEFPEVKQAKIYGSRARGDYRKYSDIDLAIYGDFKEEVTAEIRERLYELETIYQFDVLHFEYVGNEKLKENIEKEGIDLGNFLRELSLLNLIQNVEITHMRIGEVTQYEQPTKYIVKSTTYDDDFNIPVLTAGKTFILGYTNEIEGVYQATKKPVIIFDDFTTANKWVDFDFKVKSSAMKMITTKDEKIALQKYIYYWIQTIKFDNTDGDHKRQWIGNYSNKLIPIPPLETQQKIVKILDKMTDYVTELTAELTAELTLRQQQYSYFRDKLLTFDENRSGGDEH